MEWIGEERIWRRDEMDCIEFAGREWWRLRWRGAGMVSEWCWSAGGWTECWEEESSCVAMIEIEFTKQNKNSAKDRARSPHTLRSYPS